MKTKVLYIMKVSHFSVLIAPIIALLGTSNMSVFASTNSEPLVDPLRFDYEVPQDNDVLTSYGQSSIERLNPESIKILVWNLYKGKNASWSRDFKRASQGKEILLLQEVYLGPKMKQTLSKLDGYMHKTATSFIYKSKGIRTGVSNASKVAPLETHYLRSKNVEPIVNTPKVTLLNYYPIENSPSELLTINIHAVNFVTVAALSSQLSAAAKKIEAHSGPVIFAGDFNTWSERKIELLKNISSTLNLQEVKFSNDQRTQVFGRYIDYIFVRGLSVKTSKVWANLQGSDHKALEAELTLL